MPIFEEAVGIKSNVLRFTGGLTRPTPEPGGAEIYFDGTGLKFAVNGAVGSPPTMSLPPPASSSQAGLLLDSGSGGTAFNGNVNGTMLGVNSGSGAADLLRLQKAGVDRLTVSETGIVTGLKFVFGGATTSLGTGTIHCTDLNTVGLVVKGAASQAVDLFRVTDSADVKGLAVSNIGFVGVGGDPSSVYRFSIVGSLNNGTDASMRLNNTGTGANQSVNIAFTNNLGGGSEVSNFIATYTSNYTTAAYRGKTLIGTNNAVQSTGVGFQLASASHDVAIFFNVTQKYRFQDTVMTFTDAVNIAVGTTTGTKIGTAGGAAGQLLGFFNATPVTQRLVPTGSTTDNVITALQQLGLFRQS